MSLPKMEAPRFDVVLPISKIKLTAKPFVVREQKVLLQAIEMGDLVQVNNAIDDVLKVCTFGKVDIDALCVADVEWLVLQLRAKSVGEIVSMKYRCNNMIEGDEGKMKKCNTSIPVSVSLQDIDITKFPEHEYTIVFRENVGVTLIDLSYGVYKKAMEVNDAVESNRMIRNAVINTVFDEEEQWQKTDFTDEELNEFLDNLYTSDFQKIQKFIDSMPKLTHVVDIVCLKCGSTDTITLTGLDDFLE